MTNAPAMRHTAKITLLGGMKAVAVWYDDNPEGDIVFPYPEFLEDQLHQHTRLDAMAKADRASGEAVERWDSAVL